MNTKEILIKLRETFNELVKNEVIPAAEMSPEMAPEMVQPIKAKLADGTEVEITELSVGGIVTIHSGSKTNSLENITNSLPHAIAQKTDIAKLVDIYELGKPEDKKGYLDIVFPAIKKHIPMIIASDNHNIKKYSLKENCWIKRFLQIIMFQNGFGLQRMMAQKFRFLLFIRKEPKSVRLHSYYTLMVHMAIQLLMFSVQRV